MPSQTLLVAIFVALIVAVVLGVIGLARLAALARARDAVGRDVAQLRGLLEAFGRDAADHERDIRTDLAIARNEAAGSATTLRQEVADVMSRQQQGMARELGTMSALQHDQLRVFGERLGQLTQSSESRLETLRATIEQRLDLLRAENTRKLDEMRATVDEKLQATLEQRLGASFRQVSERLEQVHRGLGEMHALATGVGDLKRVLQNVKTRGGWGEVQLATLLAEMLTPQQYETNVVTIPGTNRRVEFAIRLPGRGDDGAPCWLPIDAKFPLEDWHRLQEALERADAAAADESRKALESILRTEARTIRENYVAPPHTTDFAILFLPTEGLYAEMMSRPGFTETLQRESRVLVTGPMNLAALLNSLQMGFRSLAIEKRSSEVWRVLGAVKTEFTKFGEVLAQTKKRLDSVSTSIGEAEVRTRQIARRLKDVETLPEPEAMRLLDEGLSLDAPEDAPDEK
ncbi:MAG TPA: DNA recombination protein RmuC [Casimicrobiaceae bacterium]|jgi:DNA recombination protein RmuC|nr:DNA recombination protein RmuC [Casimicrobiaceae bacterium]